MLDRLTRVQLSIFAVVTVVCVGAISAFYLHLPAAVGIGAYDVTANFKAGGGLYENANVTYRGVTIGRVEKVGLDDDGVVASMRLNTDTPVPDNVTATVKSVSAIGEQYIDLVPPADPSKGLLRDGANIGVDRTAVGQDISELLTQAESLVNSVGDARVKDLLRETFKAFKGSGPELARMIQSSRLLIDEANNNYGQIAQLIDQAGPFLDSQIQSGDDIKLLANGLARFTAEAANADPQLRSVLETVPGATQAANATFDGIRPNFPMLAANLANVGRIGVIYRKSIEQALVIFPALLAGLTTVAGGLPADEGGKLDFKVDLGDPPPCSTGFIPPPLIRSPGDTTLRDLPTDLYCKTAQSDPAVVRGARNYPCQEFPGKRAPTIQLCRDPRGYVPIGSNPWRGPPVPYGTPVTNDRNISRPTSSRTSRRRRTTIPARRWSSSRRGSRRDPDPRRTHRSRCRCRPTTTGHPRRCPSTRRRTRSCRRTRGRLPERPRRRPPPADAPPPAELPPGQGPLLPSEATPPQASGPAAATYDSKTGVFVDPAGGTGVYADGMDKVSPAETWVDLMLDPRQA